MTAQGGIISDGELRTAVAEHADSSELMAGG